jgi:class 3 adenylate cyclase
MSSEPNLAELLKEWSQLNAELERHQRLVTVMFTDIAGSTRYFDEHGDLAGMAMLTAVNDRLQPLVTKHQGIVVKTIGDAIMAYFENPLAADRPADPDSRRPQPGRGVDERQRRFR